MSDTKNKEAVSSDEEMETEQNVEKETKKEDKKPAESDDDPSEDEKEDPEDKKEEKTPKKSSPKKKPQEEEEDEDEEDDSEEEEELQPGLLERPLIIESGKREKKKVERLDMSSSSTPKEKKTFEEGSGTKLGEIQRVEYFLNRMLGDDLKPLHRLLYNRPGTTNEIKKNIRKFSGYTFEKTSKEHEKKMLAMTKFTMSMLKNICEVCDIEKSGTKEMVMQRVMDFLMCPSSSGKPLPKSKKSKKAEKGEKRKRKPKKDKGEKDKAKKSKKVKSKEKAETDEEDESDDEDKKEAKSSEVSDVESDSEVDSSSEEEIEEEPKKKKPRKESPKKPVKKADTPKKKPAKKETKKADKESKKSDKKKNEKKEKKKTTPKPKKKVVKEVSSDSDSDDSSDEDEPLVKKAKPPTDDEIKDTVKKILDGANLEEITMKTVCKQVYAKYPDFDITDRKEFIKNTVKQIIR